MGSLFGEEPPAIVRGAPATLDDMAKAIRQKGKALEDRDRTNLAMAREVGDLLNQAWQRCQDDKEPWLPWLKKNVPFSRQ